VGYPLICSTIPSSNIEFTLGSFSNTKSLILDLVSEGIFERSFKNLFRAGLFASEKVAVEEDATEVLVPEGAFIMGSYVYANVRPVRFVRHLKEFFIDRYPVTNAQFCAFLNDKGNQQKGGIEWIDLAGSFRSEKCRIREDGDRFVVEPGFEDHPVIFVTWYGARSYAQWSGKRLPTEEEWEKAARSRLGRTYPWGNEWDSSRCNTCEGEKSGITKVGSYASDEASFGCRDMAGNVSEWTDSWYDKDQKFKVLRGGSWYASSEHARCEYRDADYPRPFDIDLGFRCARTV
jgi:formylglycine-generating enzyme required for sulfatase activity